MQNQFGNWSDLRVFLAVARAGSTHAASKVLGTAQPTVSRRIDGLERVLGLTLFDRDTRGFRLTEAGRALLPRAEAVEQAIGDLCAAAQSQGRTGTKVIRFTAPVLAFTSRLAQVLSEFSEAHPGVSFELESADRLLDIAAGEVDVAIRHSPEPPGDGVVARQMSTARSTLYGSERYAASHGLPASPEALEGHRILLYGGKAAARAMNVWLRKRIPEAQVASTCPDINSMVASVESGLALGPIPVGIARHNPALLPCFPPPPDAAIPTWLLMSPQAARRKEVRAFADFILPLYRSLYSLS